MAFFNAKNVYDVLSGLTNETVNEYLQLDFSKLRASGGRAPKPQPKGAPAAMFQAIDVNFRLRPSDGFSPLRMMTGKENAVGTVRSDTYENSYQLTIQNYRNGRRYFGEDGTQIAEPREEDISYTVEVYKLLDNFLEFMVEDAKTKGIISPTGKNMVKGALITSNSVEYKPSVKTMTKAGNPINNPMVYLKLKVNKAKDPSSFMLKSFKDQSAEAPAARLSTENADEVCKHAQFRAVISSNALTVCNTGIFLRTYIDELAVKRVVAVTTGGLSVDDEDEVPEGGVVSVD